MNFLLKLIIALIFWFSLYFIADKVFLRKRNILSPVRMQVKLSLEQFYICAKGYIEKNEQYSDRCIKEVYSNYPEGVDKKPKGPKIGFATGGDLFIKKWCPECIIKKNIYKIMGYYFVESDSENPIIMTIDQNRKQTTIAVGH